MAKKDRTGNRKSREQRKQFKVPELGYYLIVTDTEATERCYFTGLHQALPEDVRNKLVIKVVETKTRTMIDKCLELTAYDAQYRIPWIVFDRDQVQGFDEIVAEAVSKGIQVGWSNPCFIDYAKREISISGTLVSLSKKEFDIVELLSINAGQVFNRERIYDTVWGLEGDGNSDTIMEHIRKIRAKFSDLSLHNYIETVWGVGYKWIG